MTARSRLLAPAGARIARLRRIHADERGTAMLEVAVVLPVLVLMVSGIVMTGRVVQAQVAVQAVAREATRTVAVAPSAQEGLDVATERALAVAHGHGLDTARLEVVIDAGGFERGGTVRAETAYEVLLGDLPLLGQLRVTVSSSHEQAIDRYRSRATEAGGP